MVRRSVFVETLSLLTMAPAAARLSGIRGGREWSPSSSYSSSSSYPYSSYPYSSSSACLRVKDVVVSSSCDLSSSVDGLPRKKTTSFAFTVEEKPGRFHEPGSCFTPGESVTLEFSAPVISTTSHPLDKVDIIESSKIKFNAEEHAKFSAVLETTGLVPGTKILVPVGSLQGSWVVPACTHTSRTAATATTRKLQDETPAPTLGLYGETPAPISLDDDDDISSEDVCTPCYDLSPEQEYELANHEDGAKLIECDLTCLDADADPLHCNYFGLGQVCRGCGECSTCMPCKSHTPSPVIADTPSPSSIAVETPAPVDETPAPSMVVVTPAPATPSPVVEATLPPFDFGLDGDTGTPSPTDKVTPSPVDDTPEPETPSPVVEVTLPPFDFGLDGDEGTPSPTEKVTPSPVEETPELETPSPVHVAVLTPSPTKKVTPSPVDETHAPQTPAPAVETMPPFFDFDLDGDEATPSPTDKVTPSPVDETPEPSTNEPETPSPTEGDVCAPCYDLTPDQEYALANHEDGEKYIECDLTCLDSTVDPLHCNYFGLGQVCRGCGECSTCMPCKNHTPSPVIADTPSPSSIAVETPAPVDETPAPSMVVVTPAPATPSPVVEATLPPFDFGLDGDTGTPSPTDKVTPSPVDDTPEPETPSPVVEPTLPPFDFGLDGDEGTPSPTDKVTPSPVEETPELETPSPVHVAVPTPSPTKKVTPSPVDETAPVVTTTPPDMYLFPDEGIIDSSLPEQCDACSDLTDEQREVLASYDNGGKQIICDPTCLDGESDITHCNYFGLGQICRGCGDCETCTPCP